jgi:acyl carrier protein
MLASLINSGVKAESNGALDQVRGLLAEVLQLGIRCADFKSDTLLLGNLPELDSMAVVTVIAALEEHFQLVVDDDDDLAEAFVSMGSLTQYVLEKSKDNSTA